MKIIQLTIVLFLFIGISSCKKRKEITFPQTMSDNTNALYPTLENFTEGEEYSFGATLGKKAEVKIVISNITGVPQNQGWTVSNNKGWTISPLELGVSSEISEQQTFESTQEGDVDMTIVFEGTGGAAVITYYKNSEVWREKTVSW